MKKVALLLCIVLFANHLAFADIVQQAQDKDLMDAILVDVQDEDQLKIVKTKKVDKLSDKIFEDDPEKLRLILKLQKEKDVEDLESLWDATVARNSAIKFALQKISAPAEQRKRHSSIMARTVSTLINGASLVPFMMGASYGLQTASLAGGQIANRLISKKNLPKKSPITDTELIQLSNLVEDLQNKLVKSYYDYKSSINSLKECRAKLIVEKKNYDKAVGDEDDFYKIISAARYDDKALEEATLKEKVKLNRLKLERLAGHDAVEGLNLSRIVLNTSRNNEI